MTVYKLIEVVGTSGTSVSDAIRGAVERASTTLEDVQWFEVREIRGRVREGEVAEYQVKMDVAFLLHAPQKETGDIGTSVADKRQTTRTRGTRSAAAQVAAKKGQKGRAELSRSFERQPGKARK